MSLLLPVLSALLLVPPGDPGEDWPQFLGPTRDGVYAGPPLAGSWGKEGPPLLWKRVVGQGFSAPALARGRLILFHRLGEKEVVECLEAGSGRPVWTFDYPTTYRDSYSSDLGPRATPSIGGGRVYTFGAQGQLHCLDLAGGARVWSADTRERFEADLGFFGLASSPLVEGDRVLQVVGGKGRSAVAAFEASSGKVLWTAAEDRAGYASPVAATIGGKRHAFCFTRSGLWDLDPQSGEVRFQFPWRARPDASVNAATPLVIGDLVFLSASYQTGAVLLRVGESGVEKLWASDEVLSNHYASSVHRNGFLYGFDGRQESSPSLRCVELKTGRVAWSQDHFGAGTVTLAGERLLILTEDGELVLAPATPEGFRPLARARVLTGTVRAYPALAAGRLYARSETTLACFDLGAR